MLKDDKNEKTSSSNNVNDELSKQRTNKARSQNRDSGYLSDIFD